MKSKEVECNRKIAYYSAKQGSPEAQYQIGSMYEKGEGAEQDYEKANKWFVASAAQGYGKAMYPVVLAYKGQNEEKIFNWYRGAVESEWKEAYYHLGYMYYHGKGVGQNYEKAFEQGSEDAAEALKRLKDGHCLLKK